jgi:hypothetical protein
LLDRVGCVLYSITIGEGVYTIFMSVSR